jgi:hypothetical protein
VKFIIESDQVYFLFFKNFASMIKILQSFESWNGYHPEDFLSANCLHSLSNCHYCGSPRYNKIHGESARNYKLIDKEST